MLRTAFFFFLSLFMLPAQAQALSPKTDPEAIADLRVAKGSRDIAEAWLIAPTNRYQHFVQGSRYEPSGLRVKLKNGSIKTLTLAPNLVFEDRQPRLADLDGDGRDEVVLVLSHVKQGASLAAYFVVDDALKLKAKTPFIGRAYRWLNPAGIGDFDGDGSLDVSLVAMPHLVKELRVYSLKNGRFVQWGAFTDFSNHRNGSPHIGMSAQADFNGDGILDLALPSGDRRNVRIISLKGRKLSTIASIALPAPADGPFSIKAGNAPKLSVVLANGKKLVLTP